MLELFLIMQQHPEIIDVRANTIRQLHAHLHLIDKWFRANIQSRTLFMEILRQPKGITHEFRRMNKYGVLGAYLPEFGQVVGQMQHDLFHAYTVDEHTLFLVRNLRRFSCAEYTDEFPLCSEVYDQIPKHELLFVAGLFHDIAKGRGGDHSLLGIVDAQKFCSLHDLSEFDTKTITFLVRQHLTMSATAQKFDVNDPDVIKAFAAKVKTVDRLNYLYLLTVADIRATNDNLWNDWRDSLLRQLYHATRKWLEHKSDAAINVAEKSQQRWQQALQQLVFQAWPEQTVTQLWQHYESDYFLRHTTDEIVWQTISRLKNTDIPTLIKIRKHGQENTLEIFICTKEKSRVFATATACLEHFQLDILDARIDTTSDDTSLHTYIVNTITTTDQAEIIHTLESRLNDLSSTKLYDSVLIPRKMKLFETKPTIHFQTNEQHNHTIVELGTHDRPGLISAIAQVFLQCNIQVINAKLITLGDQVEDVFLITTDDHMSLSSEEQSQLHQALTTHLTQ
jgi:[protein-PII] uridylyltransferase